MAKSAMISCPSRVILSRNMQLCFLIVASTILQFLNFILVTQQGIASYLGLNAHKFRSASRLFRVNVESQLVQRTLVDRCW
jgi:hypothetical protein